MALADERVAKALEISVKNLQTARIVGAEGVIAANDVERRPLLRTRLGGEQCALSPLRTDSLPFVSKIYWPENADDAIMDVP